jgi:hypothetical protein
VLPHIRSGAQFLSEMSLRGVFFSPKFPTEGRRRRGQRQRQQYGDTRGSGGTAEQRWRQQRQRERVGTRGGSGAPACPPPAAGTGAAPACPLSAAGAARLRGVRRARAARRDGLMRSVPRSGGDVCGVLRPQAHLLHLRRLAPSRCRLARTPRQ